MLLMLNCMINEKYEYKDFHIEFQVRRGKINERLKCLKDIVPGCYKVIKIDLNQIIILFRL